MPPLDLVERCIARCSLPSARKTRTPRPRWGSACANGWRPRRTRRESTSTRARATLSSRTTGLATDLSLPHCCGSGSCRSSRPICGIRPDRSRTVRRVRRRSAIDELADHLYQRFRGIPHRDVPAVGQRAPLDARYLAPKARRVALAGSTRSNSGDASRTGQEMRSRSRNASPLSARSAASAASLDRAARRGAREIDRLRGAHALAVAHDVAHREAPARGRAMTVGTARAVIRVTLICCAKKRARRRASPSPSDQPPAARGRRPSAPCRAWRARAPARDRGSCPRSARYRARDRRGDFDRVTRGGERHRDLWKRRPTVVTGERRRDDFVASRQSAQQRTPVMPRTVKPCRSTTCSPNPAR